MFSWINIQSHDSVQDRCSLVQCEVPQQSLYLPSWCRQGCLSVLLHFSDELQKSSVKGVWVHCTNLAENLPWSNLAENLPWSNLAENLPWSNLAENLPWSNLAVFKTNRRIHLSSLWSLWWVFYHYFINMISFHCHLFIYL